MTITAYTRDHHRWFVLPVLVCPRARTMRFGSMPHLMRCTITVNIYYFEQEALIYITIIVLYQAFSYLLFPLFCLLLLLDLLYTPSGSNAILYRARHILLSTYAHCSQIYESASTSLNVVPMKSSSIGIIIGA